MERTRPKRKVNMAIGICRTLNHVCRWSALAALALAFSLCIFSLVWGKSSGHHRRAVKLEREAYGEKILSPGAKALERRYKKRIVIARKRGRGRSSQNKEFTERKWRDYERLSPEEKARTNRKFREWKSLPPEKQDLMRRRMERWKGLPPEDRSLYKQRFKQWQRLSPEEQERIRERLEKWNGLPHEEKEELRRRFRK
jgi:hypothetical protein